MKKILIMVVLVAAAGCAPRMENEAFMDACDACKARGYSCAELYQGLNYKRTGVQCYENKDAGKANLQAMLQIATEPLDARNEKGKRPIDKRARK